MLLPLLLTRNCCTSPAYCYPLVCVLLPLLLTHNCLERILPLLLIEPRNEHGPTVNTYHVIAIHSVFWRVGPVNRKYIFLYCCVLDRVYRAVAWQSFDQIGYNILIVLPSSCQIVCRSYQFSPFSFYQCLLLNVNCSSYFELLYIVASVV
jgi:hypothetical protein